MLLQMLPQIPGIRTSVRKERGRVRPVPDPPRLPSPPAAARDATEIPRRRRGSAPPVPWSVLLTEREGINPGLVQTWTGDQPRVEARKGPRWQQAIMDAANRVRNEGGPGAWALNALEAGATGPGAMVPGPVRAVAAPLRTGIGGATARTPVGAIARPSSVMRRSSEPFEQVFKPVGQMKHLDDYMTMMSRLGGP